MIRRIAASAADLLSHMGSIVAIVNERQGVEAIKVSGIAPGGTLVNDLVEGDRIARRRPSPIGPTVNIRFPRLAPLLHHTLTIHIFYIHCHLEIDSGMVEE